MSQDFLSQEEVDALLKGVAGDSDEAPPEQQEHDGSVKSYDLGRQGRIVRGRMPAFDLINERFARYLRTGLLSYMHRSTDISVGPLTVQKYSEFLGNLVVPTNLNLIQARPLRGTGLIVFDPNLVFLIVDNMFGGDGRFHTAVEGRDFTATEQRIVQGILGVVFEEYQRAWAPVVPLQFEYVRSEMNTQFANIATPSEMVVSATFTLELSGTSAEMHVCLPYAMIEPIRDALCSTMQSEQASSDKRWTGTLKRQLQTAEVELVATLGGADVTFGDIVKMKVGDVIPITLDPKVPVAVNGVPVAECRYGMRNGQYALKIERFFAEEDA